MHKTLDDAIETVKEVIEEAGSDYNYLEHYETCYYSVDGEPACIVGRVLAKWGVLPEDVDSTRQNASLRVGMFAGELLSSMERDGELSTTLETKNFLTSIQTFQDNGLEWGLILRHTQGHFEE